MGVMVVKKTIDLELDVTPEDVAKLFCDMDEVDQAKFFNEVSIITEDENWCLPMQLQFIIDSPVLTRGGRSVMELIGEYGRE